jgi:integrase
LKLKKTLAFLHLVPFFVPKLVPEMGKSMAGKLRYWKEKGGRFWARIAVPARLRPFLDHPRSELLEPLGGDRRAALRIHSAAVAKLQREIALAEERANFANPSASKIASTRTPITTADFGRAVWQRYNAALKADEETRELYPSNDEIAGAVADLKRRAEAGEITADPLEIVAASLDYLRLKNSRASDQLTRKTRLNALKRELAAGETHQVEHEIEAYIDARNLTADQGTAERAVLAKQMMRAEIEAMIRTLERDAGDYGGQISDAIVKPPAQVEAAEPVKLSQLWADYLKGRLQAGFIKDGGRRQEPVIRNLIAFLKHNDAHAVTKKDLLAWRDYLMGEMKLSSKTVSDIYLSTVRSLFAWAHENERLGENVAEKVRQPKARKVDGREKGYTDAEALAVLKASRAHVPKPNQFGYVKETPHMTAAKRWAPILAAFSGARISEITQLRKEDVRQEGDHWIARITPHAGSVKSGGFRDVPLHNQIVALGFIDFVKKAKDGPLFHGATDPAKFATAAQSISDELAKWLHSLKLVPEGVRPNYGWRHRLKTTALELGLTMRVIDVLQGHAARTAGENYGDVTISAKVRVISALPFYDLAET